MKVCDECHSIACVYVYQVVDYQVSKQIINIKVNAVLIHVRFAPLETLLTVAKIERINCTRYRINWQFIDYLLRVSNVCVLHSGI